MEEYKELQVGTYTFRIRFHRSFKAQCDLLRLKREIEADDVVKADCQLEVLNYDDKGKVQGKKWVPLTDEFLEKLSADDGLKLYNEVIDFRLKKKVLPQKKEVKASKPVSKKDGSEKEESSPSASKS